MFLKIPIKEFKVEHHNTAVLGGDVFDTIGFLNKRKGKLYREKEYSLKILERLFDGEFYGIITDLEYGKAKNKVGREIFYKLVDSKIQKNKKARCFKIEVAAYLEEYEEVPAYNYLFKLTRDKTMHLANLSSIIIAIEFDIPIVSNDPHFYWQRRNIVDAYRKRHREERKLAIKKGEKTKDIKIYTPQHFIKWVLPGWRKV